MTHSCVTWLIHVWHDSFIWGMTHLHETEWSRIFSRKNLFIMALSPRCFCKNHREEKQTEKNWNSWIVGEHTCFPLKNSLFFFFRWTILSNKIYVWYILEYYVHICTIFPKQYIHFLIPLFTSFSPVFFFPPHFFLFSFSFLRSYSSSVCVWEREREKERESHTDCIREREEIFLNNTAIGIFFKKMPFRQLLY